MLSNLTFYINNNWVSFDWSMAMENRYFGHWLSPESFEHFKTERPSETSYGNQGDRRRPGTNTCTPVTTNNRLVTAGHM